MTPQQKTLVCATGQCEQLVAKGLCADCIKNIAEARKSHVKGAGNRCCCQRQNRSVYLERFEFFFVFNPETMFFVDDNESKVMKFYISR